MRGKREAEAAEERKGSRLVPHIVRNLFLTPCVLSKIFLTSFTFGSEGGPRPPFNPAVEKKTLTEKKELMNTKGDLHPYKANIPLFSLAEVIEVAIRAEYQVARTHISGPIKA